MRNNKHISQTCLKDIGLCLPVLLTTPHSIVTTMGDPCIQWKNQQIRTPCNFNSIRIGSISIMSFRWTCKPLCNMCIHLIALITLFKFITFILNLRNIHENFVEYCQSHITLLWIWIMLCYWTYSCHNIRFVRWHSWWGRWSLIVLIQHIHLKIM